MKKSSKKKKDVKFNNPTPGNFISNCNFTGIHWDAKAMESVNLVAQGLLNLTRLFSSQDIKIDCLLKIDSPSTENLKPLKSASYEDWKAKQ